MDLLLVRHGESEGNAAGLIQGRLDYGLTPTGLEQAKRTAARLGRERTADRLLSSPLVRARQTADVIAAAIGLPVEVDDDLAEYHIGEIAGLNAAEVRRQFPHIREAYSRGEFPALPGEEGRDAFHLRVGRFIERARDSGQSAIVVAHGGVIAAMCYAVLGIDPGRRGLLSVANCSLTEIQAGPGGRLVLGRHNDTCHLDPARD